MKTRHYTLSSLFGQMISLVVGPEITVSKSGRSYLVNRQEAANILRIGKREKLIDKSRAVL